MTNLVPKVRPSLVRRRRVSALRQPRVEVGALDGEGDRWGVEGARGPLSVGLSDDADRDRGQGQEEIRW